MKYGKTHGMSKSSEYKIWAAMKRRCCNPNEKMFYRYGGRGIKVCDRWLNSFENFYADMGPRPSDQHSIDRKNNDGNYDPNNCHWATIEQQVYNKSTNIDVIDPDTGELLTTKEAMEKYGLCKGTLFTRLDRGVPINTPVQEYNKEYLYKGKLYTSAQLAEIANLPVDIIRSRLAQGFTVEKAVELPLQTDPTYLYQDKYLTVKEICELTGIEDFNLRYHLRNGKTVEEAIQINQEYNTKYLYYPYKGKLYTVTELAKLFNTAYSTINVRLKRGETPEEIEIALQESHVKNPGKFEYQGKYYTVSELCEMTGFTPKGFYRHLNRGLAVEEAIQKIKENSTDKTYLVDGKEMTMTEIADMLKCAKPSIIKHLKKGRTMQEAVDRMRQHRLVVKALAAAVTD